MQTAKIQVRLCKCAVSTHKILAQKKPVDRGLKNFIQQMDEYVYLSVQN